MNPALDDDHFPISLAPMLLTDPMLAREYKDLTIKLGFNPFAGAIPNPENPIKASTPYQSLIPSQASFVNPGGHGGSMGMGMGMGAMGGMQSAG